MSDPRTITVTAREWDGFEVPATKFVHELSELLVTVPEEHRDNAILEFDRYGDDYDTSRGELTLRYTRPETDEERRVREANEEHRLAAAQERERAQYERLKAKFG